MPYRVKDTFDEARHARADWDRYSVGELNADMPDLCAPRKKKHAHKVYNSPVWAQLRVEVWKLYDTAQEKGWEEAFRYYILVLQQHLVLHPSTAPFSIGWLSSLCPLPPPEPPSGACFCANPDLPSSL